MGDQEICEHEVREELQDKVRRVQRDALGKREYLEARIIEHKINTTVLERLDVLPHFVLVIFQDEVMSGSLCLLPDRLQIGDIGLRHVREKGKVLAVLREN